MRNEENLYRAERVRAALASDPAVCELGIDVVIVYDRIVLRGTVTSDRRKAEIFALVRKLAPDLEIGDELRVEILRQPTAESV